MVLLASGLVGVVRVGIGIGIAADEVGVLVVDGEGGKG